MKRIPLTQGLFAIIDDADYNIINRFKWRAVKSGNHIYAVREEHIGMDNSGKRLRRSVYMHRFIIFNIDNFDTDHINGNTLDNRRCNLRICNHTENTRNRHISRGGTSRFKGVHFHKVSGKWRAMIKITGRQRHLGLFINEIEAAQAYDQAALKYFSEFACVNFAERLGIEIGREIRCAV